MKTTHMPQNGSADLLLPGIFQQATLTIGPSLMSPRRTSKVTRKPISSPALAGGLMQPDLLAGLTTVRSGLAPVPVSHSVLPGLALGLPTSGTSGLSGSGSSASAALQSSWGSRFLARLARVGSTECSLTWRVLATPAGRPLPRLVPSMRPIGEIGCGLLPSGLALAHSMGTWPTPTAVDYKGPNPLSRSPADDDLPTPVARQAALWATPRAADWRSGSVSAETWEKNSRPLTEQVTVHSGAGLAGSSVLTGKSAGLNPEFVCWLMGYPVEWLFAAPDQPPSSPRRSTGTHGRARSEALATP